MGGCPTICAYSTDTPPSQMIVDKEVSDNLIELQEDVAEHFTNENFPLSGEAYWTMVECIAHAKLAQLKGLIH